MFHWYFYFSNSMLKYKRLYLEIQARMHYSDLRQFEQILIVARLFEWLRQSVKFFRRNTPFLMSHFFNTANLVTCPLLNNLHELCSAVHTFKRPRIKPGTT